MRWLNEDFISMKTEIKSTLWHGSQVLENQSRNFLLFSCCQISLSIKSYIIFKTDFRLWFSYSMQENQYHCFVHAHFVCSSTQPSFHACSLSKFHSNLQNKHYCVNVIYKLTQQINRHYENYNTKNKQKTWQSRCLINKHCLKVYSRLWKLKLCRVCKLLQESFKIIGPHTCNARVRAEIMTSKLSIHFTTLLS